ncbi:Exocyst complex component SEC10 [Nakaseomyces bracarensis]|uniref:Exocyst complex component SEC10 n=1 Tax=Nakaseomyces bracarensis TaxID=273131 RepID=A0ABR4NVE2_9SACH
MNSLYELDPKWKKLILDTNNFLGGLTVDEFVQELSKDKDDVVSSSWNKKLDPKPYIRTFESTLKELTNLQGQMNNEKMAVAESVATKELQYSHNILNLSSDLTQLIDNYNHLDNKLTSINQLISPLSEKLQNSIKKKKNYIKSIELIIQYNYFWKEGKSQYLDNLKNSKKLINRLNAAILMKNLLILSKKVETNSIESTKKTTEIIEKYSEDMENQMLTEFNNAYKDNNFNQLNEIALILNHYNGGINVIQSFINQHNFFIDSGEVIESNSMDTPFLNDETKNSLMDPNYHGVIYSQGLVNMIDEIEEVVKNESKIVKRVFEDSAAYVIQLFIQRVFAQKIEPKFEFFLNTALSVSHLAYVRTLHALYTMLGKFVKDLSEYFELLEVENEASLQSTLEQCYSDFFSRYIYDRSKYFDIEKRSLEIILIEMTSTFNTTYEKEIRQKQLTNKYKSISNDIPEARINELSSTNNSNSKLSQFNTFIKSRLDRDRLPVARSNSTKETEGSHNGGNREDGTLPLDDGFNLETVDSMIKCIVESIARVMELVPNKATSCLSEILELASMGIIGSYVKNSLEVAYATITRIDITKTEIIDLTALRYVSISTEILSLLSTLIKAVCLPLLSNYPDVKKKVIMATNSQVKNCETMINIIIEEIFQVFSTKFSHSLSKQKKKDFLPKSLDMLDQDTQPAIEIVNLLNNTHSQVSDYLKSQNLVTFLTSVGDDLYRLLIDHYGKFQVNSAGGIIVTKDIIGFQTAIDDWGIQTLSDKFASLRELANLFTIQPDLLDSLTKEGHLAHVNRSIIQTYIANREDFNHDTFMSNMKFSLKQYT